MATGETLLVDRPRAGIAVATLNRPDRLNALTFEMFDELAQLAADVGTDDRVRVLVLTGAGRGFCAGLDLRDAATLPDMPTARFLEGQVRRRTREPQPGTGGRHEGHGGGRRGVPGEAPACVHRPPTRSRALSLGRPIIN